MSGCEDAFLHNRLVQDAVLRNLQTMAESSKRLSEDFKSKHQEVDWRRMAGFRNILVHDYLGVDIQLVWRIVERELPALEQAVRTMLAGNNYD